jgi:hypothetical protein
LNVGKAASNSSDRVPGIGHLRVFATGGNVVGQLFGDPPF